MKITINLPGLINLYKVERFYQIRNLIIHIKNKCFQMSSLDNFTIKNKLNFLPLYQLYNKNPSFFWLFVAIISLLVNSECAKLFNFKYSSLSEVNKQWKVAICRHSCHGTAQKCFFCVRTSMTDVSRLRFSFVCSLFYIKIYSSKRLYYKGKFVKC